MSSEEPIPSRTFTRGGRPGRGRGGPRRGGRGRDPRHGGPRDDAPADAGWQAEPPPRAPPADKPEWTPRGGARPRNGGRAQGRGGRSGPREPREPPVGPAVFSESVVAFINSTQQPGSALLPTPPAPPQGPAPLLPTPQGPAPLLPTPPAADGFGLAEDGAQRGGHGDRPQRGRHAAAPRPDRRDAQKQHGDYRDNRQHAGYRDNRQHGDFRDGQRQRDGYRNDYQPNNGYRNDYQPNNGYRNDYQPNNGYRNDYQPNNGYRNDYQPNNGYRNDYQQQQYDGYRNDYQQQQYDGYRDGHQQYDSYRDGGQRQYVDYREPTRRQRGRRGVNKSQTPAAQQKPVVPRAPSPSEADLGQRERMVEQLTHGHYECLVCVDPIRQADPVWNCHSCFHVFHMGCVRRWARSSKAESGGWRCPACQNVSATPPTSYKCFCGKMRDPPWNRRDTPHSCGEVCGRSRADVSCTHRCTLLCHPGPCPPCTASVKRSCPCGKQTVDIRCELAATLTCEDTCGRSLNCGVHTCAVPCHVGDCAACDVQLELVCFCGKVHREEVCAPETADAGPFCCGDPCGRQLACGRHHCDKLCHEGECGDCPLSPTLVERCPCGARPLSELPSPPRTSCADPVPTCGGVCRRRLPCGRPGEPHTCRAVCHAAACPPCARQTAVRCRCGFMDREIPCTELTTRADDARCQKRCSKKRSCGRHKCGQECCILLDHTCQLTCGRKLTCGVHACEEPCHVGQCRPCLQASFEELYCECGASVLYPPVQCGTPRPPCDQTCSRVHPCGHTVHHNCHSQPDCPPCTQLMKKVCYGGHEERGSVPCHQTAVSCGRPCGKPLPCQRHKCKEPCHAGSCPEAEGGCKQACDTARPDCRHPCGVPCHDRDCPSSPCRTKVRVSCECGHRTRTLACSDTGVYRAINTSLIAHKLSAIQAGGATVDVSELMSGATGGKNGKARGLQCNAECAVLERNRRLAVALQIRNPELSGKAGPPTFPPSMLEMARKAKGLAEEVHQQLTDLVQLAQQSKQKSRSVAFAPMNRERRQFIHEYCEHFGCESESYDEEPKRNVVATAHRDRCWLPTLSVLQMVERESGPRKIAPAPRLASKREPGTAAAATSAAGTAVGGAASTKPAKSESEKAAAQVIDYFDFTG